MSSTKLKMLAKNLERFKVITFDCTNTLLFFRNPPEVQYLKTASNLGIPEENFDKNLMKANFRKTFKELHQKYPNFGKDSISFQTWWERLVINVFLSSSKNNEIDSELLRPVAKELIHLYQTKECWGKFNKSDELITALKDCGKTVGVISNFDPRLHHLLKDLNLTMFDFVVTSYEAGVEKPDPKIFHHAAKISGQDFDSSEALHIGNEVVKDFKGAQGANWSALLINSDSTNHVNFKNVEEFWNGITSSEVNV